MLINSFSKSKMEILNKISFPDLSLPLGIKLIWIETVDLFAIKNNITLENHQHSFNEIHFVFSGNITYCINGKNFTANCGQAFIIPVNNKHKFISSSDDILKTTIAFSADSGIFSESKIFNFCDNTSKNLDSVFSMCEENNILIPHLLAGRITEILYYTIKNISVTLPEVDNKKHDPRFLVAKAFIENNIDSKISIGQVASECCLSSKQLNRIFHKETGNSVSDYINLSKINSAKKLLMESNLSIKEISFATGFENTSSFIPFFKKHCSVTPGEFKNQMSKN